MTNRETLRAVIDEINSDGGMPQEKWITFLLTRIADSLTIIADALTDSNGNEAVKDLLPRTESEDA